MSGPTPTLPSSGSHSIVRVNSALPSSPQDINPSQSATLNFYGNAPLRRSNSQGRARPGSVDNSAPRARKTSAPSSTAASAPFNAFAAPPVPTSTRSQTHAGGILPPASFFRPTRPAAVIQPATPGSPSRRPVAPYGSPPPASITVRPSSPPPPENISTAPPQRQQSANDSLASTQPLARQLTSGSEGSGTFGINTGTAPSSEGHSRNPSITTSVTSPNNPYGPKPKAEQSRERLLPIGEKSTRSLVSDTTPTATTALPNNVRKSFDRIFFKRQASTGRESAPGQTPVTTTYPPDAQTLPHLSNIPQSPDTPTFSPDQRRPGSRHPHFAPTPRVSASIENHSDGHDHSSLPPGYALIPTPSGKPARNWMFHPANNRFMFKGRFITGSGDSPLPFLFTLAVVLAIAGTWLGATVPWWWHNKSPAVGIIGGYLCLLTLTSMAMTVCVACRLTLL